jgi:hypothetical protein
VEENLDKYIRGISSMYNALAYIKLSMNYYTMYDMNRELDETDELYDKMYDEFVEIVGRLLKGELDVPVIENFRQRIINVMDVVVAYIDRLRIYEHILNRVEYRFKDADFDKAYYNTYLTNDLMHYILSDKDNVVINSKIANIVGQLPVRISKNTYFEHIRDAFSLYHGAQKGTIDDFKYSLSTTSMLTEPDNFSDIFPDMPHIFEELKNADYANIDGDEYLRLHGLLETGANKMNKCADLFVLLASMVNDIYTIVLSDAYKLGDTEEVELAREIIIELYESDAEGNRITDEISDKFVRFEGKQERIMDTISGCDYVVHEFPESHSAELEEAGKTADFEVLSKVAKLQSGSEFVQLHGDEDYSEIPDDSYADKASDELIEDMTKLFENVSIQVRRAVMATVLSQLPVFFNNTEEIQSYINISLMQCSDDAEQKATVEILKALMEG